MIFDVIGDRLTDGCQLKHLVLDNRIVYLFGKLSIHCRLISEIIRPIHRASPAGRRSFRFHLFEEMIKIQFSGFLFHRSYMAAERSCIFIRADFFLGQHPQPVHLLFGPWPRHGLRQPHRGQLGPVVGVADHRRRIVRKDARHRRQVADVTVDNAKQRDDCGLVGGDAVEIADVGLLRMSICVVGEIGRHMPIHSTKVGSGSCLNC
jgi:hypothetical protein